MNCHEARQHLMLYLDSEGDAELHFRINEHLGMCPDCAEWFSKQNRLEGLLAEKLRAGGNTPELWERVLSRAGVVQPARSRARAWLWLSGLAACAAVVAVLVLWRLSLSPAPPSPDLAKLTSRWHQKLVEGMDLDFRSASDLEIEKYLRQRVTFPVRCPPRKDAGFAVQGAGVCELATTPAAYLSGHVDRVPISIFVLPADGLSAFPHQLQAVRKDKVHRCREGNYEMVLALIDRNAVLVIGQTESQRLEKVLKAYGTYPESH
jgi:anti-sigma factor RsiW